MGRDPAPLVVRFGRLGDLVLTWPALRALAEREGPVDLVTSARYGGLMASLPWVREVWTVEGLGGSAGAREVLALARALRAAGPWRVIDLHGSLRSRLLCGALGGAGRRVHKASLPRRLRVGLRIGARRIRLDPKQPARSFPRRFLDAIGADAGADDVPRMPWPDSAPRPENPPALALLPGARRATKRWPAASYGALARGWQARHGGPARVFHGPGEEALAEAVIEAAGGAAERFVDLDLGAHLRGMAACRVAVGGDSGLLHLAAAAGASPLGLFGPTGAEMGYWPWRDAGRALTPDLPCHPCSLYGDDACPLEHHACLAELEPAQVLDQASALLGVGR